MYGYGLIYNVLTCELVPAGFGGADFSGREQLSGSQRRGVVQRTECVGAPHGYEGGEILSCFFCDHLEDLIWLTLCDADLPVPAVSPEPGTDGAEADPAGADE